MEEARHPEPSSGFEIIKRDENSSIGRDPSIGPLVVRRLVEGQRFDPERREDLLAEAAFGSRLECERCPRAEGTWKDDGELFLTYRRSDGVVLDRLLDALDRSGHVLTPIAAAGLLSEVFHTAEHLANRPEEGAARGHGEIEPRAIVIGADGMGRLFESRLAATGVASRASRIGLFCRAPELLHDPEARTVEGDVYAMGAVLALSLLGPRALMSDLDSGGMAAVEHALTARPGLISPDVAVLLEHALAPQPEYRFRSAEAFRTAFHIGLDLRSDRWRIAIEGLSALTTALGGDRQRREITPALLDAYPVTVMRADRPEPPAVSSAASLRPSRATVPPPPAVTTPGLAPFALPRRPTSVPSAPSLALLPAPTLANEPARREESVPKIGRAVRKSIPPEGRASPVNEAVTRVVPTRPRKAQSAWTFAALAASVVALGIGAVALLKDDPHRPVTEMKALRSEKEPAPIPMPSPIFPPRTRTSSVPRATETSTRS